MIFMSSAYTDGMRIAYDITGSDDLIKDESKKVIALIKSECGDDAFFSTHFVQTGDPSWKSVQEYDPFFADVKCFSSKKEFVDKIKQSRVLTGMDVANYILSRIKCTHLSLEKLVYLSYADYLCDFGKQLFQDKIYAFTYGPVVDSVNRVYKKSGVALVDPQVKDTEIKESLDELPFRSRILFAEDGIKKIKSIEKTLKKYGEKSAQELVCITHREGSPWSYVDSQKPYQRIADQLILEHHSVEYI